MTTVTAIIQSRMTSSRLPGKALLDLAGRPLTWHVIQRVTAIPSVGTVVLATCHGAAHEPLIDLARDMGIDYFIGSEDNVLERYYHAWQHFGGDYVMRVTGDNPFTDTQMGDLSARMAIETQADLFHLDHLPLGTGVSMIRATALAEAYRKSDRPYHFEHVTPYIKEHEEAFRVLSQPAPVQNPFPGLRLTVDEPDDFELARRLYAALYHGTPFTLDDVFTYLKKNPQLADLNSAVVQRPMKHSSGS